MPDKKNILIVDDEPMSRDGIRQSLIRYGYDVETAQDGRKALETIKKNRYDLIITDLVMPELNGINLLKTVRVADSDIGFIIITGYGEVESYLESMNLGAFAYLNKPIKIPELKKVINNFFKESGYPEESEPLVPTA